MISTFENTVKENIIRLGNAHGLSKKSLEWMLAVGVAGNYTYNFSFLGRPIIQYPQDIIAMQEIIWAVKPDLIIETGIAHGGSIIMSASMLALLDIAEAIENGEKTVNPAQSRRKILGIDIEIRPHNRTAIEAHPMFSRIQMIEGTSVGTGVIEQVYSIAENYKHILVCLDSMHTHDHVLSELKAYAPLVTKGSYCVVFDTIIEEMPDDLLYDKPWGKGNNPKTAVREYLKTTDRFIIDKDIEHKLLITVAPDGYLKCVKENS